MHALAAVLLSIVRCRLSVVVLALATIKRLRDRITANRKSPVALRISETVRAHIGITRSSTSSSIAYTTACTVLYAALRPRALQLYHTGPEAAWVCSVCLIDIRGRGGSCDPLFGGPPYAHTVDISLK